MMQDKYQFFGGPYDGHVVDWLALNSYSTLIPFQGDFGVREFAIVPPLDRWGQPASGAADDEPSYVYERVNRPDGVGFELRSRRALDEAWRQTRLKIDPRAKSALLALPDDIRQAAVEALCDLDRKYPQFWPADSARKISDAPLYLVNLPKDYRAFVRVTGTGELELADIAQEETIRWFVEHYHKAGRADEAVR